MATLHVPLEARTQRIQSKDMTKPGEAGANAAQSEASLNLRRKRTKLSANELATMRATFDKFDADNSGNIDGTELREIMRFLGHEISQAESEALMRQIDVNGNGTLEFDEFTQLLRLYKEAAQFKLMEDESGGGQSSQDLRMKQARQLKNYPSDSFFVVMWQLVILVTSIYFLMLVLYCDTLPLAEGYSITRSTIFAEVIASCLFLADILISFRVSSERTNMDRWSKKYATRYLLFDLASLLPWQLFTEDEIAVRALYHMRLLRFVKVPSFFKASGRLDSNRAYVYLHFYFIPVVRILLFYVSFVHVAAVVYYFVRIDAVGRSAEKPFSYLDALFFVAYSVTGVGYGQIITESTLERVYACVMCLCAQVFSAVIVGSVVKIVAQSDVTATKQHKTRFLRDITTMYSFPTALRDEMLGFHDHLEDDSLSDAYRDLIENLPALLQSNITLFVKMRLISASSLFRNAHRATQVALAEELESRICKPAEVVYHVGDERTDMYFVVYGFVSILRADGSTVCTLMHGDHFAEDGMLTGYSDKTSSARCETYSELFTMSRLSFLGVLKQFPLFRNEMTKLGDNCKILSPRMSNASSAASRSLSGTLRSETGGGTKRESSVVFVDASEGEHHDGSNPLLATGNNDGSGRKQKRNSSVMSDGFGGDMTALMDGVELTRVMSVVSAIADDDEYDDDNVETEVSDLLAQDAKKALQSEGSQTKMASEEDEVLLKCGNEIAEIEQLVAHLEKMATARSLGIDLSTVAPPLGGSGSEFFLGSGSAFADFPVPRAGTAGGGTRPSDRVSPGPGSNPTLVLPQAAVASEQPEIVGPEEEEDRETKVEVIAESEKEREEAEANENLALPPHAPRRTGGGGGGVITPLEDYNDDTGGEFDDDPERPQRMESSDSSIGSDDGGEPKR